MKIMTRQGEMTTIIRPTNKRVYAVNVDSIRPIHSEVQSSLGLC